MKKRLLLALLAVVLVVSLVAFAACAKEEEPPEEEEEVWQWPERIVIPVSSTSSPLYGSQIAWSTPLSKETGMVVRIISEANFSLQEMNVKEGRFFCKAPSQYTSIRYATPGFASRELGPWQSRVWMAVGVAYQGASVLGDSGIKTPYDIKPGMKVAWQTLIEEPQQAAYGILAWGQINPEDVTFVPGSSNTAFGRMLLDGKIDYFLGSVVSSYLFEVEASPHGLGWIAMDWEKDPEGAARFLEWFPFTGFGIATGGIPSSEGIPMLKGLVASVTSADTDPELVYQMIKWLDENYDQYKDGHPWCQAMTIDNLLEIATTSWEPLHDGAVRYIEEKGLWTAELEARRQYNIEIMTKWVEAYQDAIAMADDKGMMVTADNEEWQELWDNYRDSLNLPLFVNYQERGKEQPSYSDFYDRWHQTKADLGF